MKAVLVLAGTDSASFLANLVDRPFLRHIVEFLVDRGIRDILVVGPGAEQARILLGSGDRWGASIAYRAAHSVSGRALEQFTRGESCLLASAASLPRFPLAAHTEQAAGAIVYGAGGCDWTGWAVIAPGDIALLPPLYDHAALLSYLRGLPDYAGLCADVVFRCGSAEDLWKAHRDAQLSNLSAIFHGGVEVSPGVWMGRNASVARSAQITSPVYIGENSRIGAGAQIGPFAVIGKDCLIAPGTGIRHSVVAPGTYAGDNLELDHVLVDKRHLFDVRFGVSIDRVDPPLLDGVFDFHWSAIPRWVYDAVVSSVTSWFTDASLTFTRAWSGLRSENRPRRRRGSGRVDPGETEIEIRL